MLWEYYSLDNSVKVGDDINNLEGTSTSLSIISTSTKDTSRTKNTSKAVSSGASSVNSINSGAKSNTVLKNVATIGSTKASDRVYFSKLDLANNYYVVVREIGSNTILGYKLVPTGEYTNAYLQLNTPNYCW